MDCRKDCGDSLNFGLTKPTDLEKTNEKQLLLNQFLEMFNGRLDADVINIVFAEFEDHNKALEHLFTLASDVNDNENGAKSESKFVEKPSFNEILKKNSNVAVKKFETNSKTIEKNLSESDKVLALIKSNKKVLVIMRGLPGSGKSTLAHNLVRCTSGKVFSTDDYFTSRNEIFQFDWTKLDEAHKWNQNRALSAMVNGVTPVIIDNTNLQLWEMSPYVRMGFEHDYEIRLLEPETTWKYKINYLAKANKHGICREKIERMFDRFERNVTVDDIVKTAVKSNAQNSNLSTSSSPSPSTMISGKDLHCPLNNNHSRPNNSTESVTQQEGFWDKEICTKKENGSPLSPTLLFKFPFPEKQNQQVLTDQSPKPQRTETKRNKINTEWIPKSNDTCDKESQETEKISDNNNNGMSRKLLKLTTVNNGNWEFPAFPTFEARNKDKTDDSNDQRFVYYHCSSSQTEDRDWALLETKQNNGSNKDLENLNLNEKYLKLDTIAMQKSSQQVSLRSVRLDRGSSTTDSQGDLTYEQKIERLKSNFPRIQESHLHEVLKSCHEDYEWTYNLFTEFSEDYFTQFTEESGPKSNSPPPSLDPSQTFTLKLNNELCVKLQSLFGSVEDNFVFQNGNDQIIEINTGVAKLIYHLWKKTWKKKSEESQLSLPNNGNDGNKNIGKQVNENKLGVETPKSKFEEIMDLEMALKISWDEYYSTESGEVGLSEDCLSTKLKREQLYNSFPGLDRQTLDEIFDASQHKLNEAITVIGQSLGVSASLSEQTEIWVAAEIVQRSKRNFTHKDKVSLEKEICEVQDYAEVKYFDDTRLKMFELISRRKECLHKARSSYHQKNFAVASYYSSQARNYQNEINTLSNDIVNIVIDSHSSNKLDLHGLHAAEVLLTVSAFLSLKVEEMRRKKYNRLVVEIVTGWGAHSRTAPRIKPIVLGYLASKRYKYEVANPGVVQVILTN